MSSLERLEGAGAPDRTRWALAFYARRAFRIYPLAVVGIVVTIALRMPAHILPPIAGNHYEGFSPFAIASNLLLVQNLVGAPHVLGVLWSLPLEVQMYVMLPGLYLIARRRSFTGMAIALVAAVALGLFVHLVPMRGVWRLTVLTFAPCFLAGVLAYHVARRRRPVVPAAAWPLALLGLAALFAAIRLIPGHPERSWIGCLLIGLLIPLVRDLPASAVTRAAHQIAKYSYGVYIWHVGALWVGFGLGGALPLAARWAVAAAVLVAASVASYHLVEKPMVDLGGHVGDRILGRRRAPTLGRAAAQ